MSRDLGGLPGITFGGRRYNWSKLRPNVPVMFGQQMAPTLAAEQYRKLAVQLEERMERAERSSFVLAVASPEPGTGKTLTGLNLALAIARGGEKRVLLIECDLWKPRLTDYLDLPESMPGLAQILTRNVSLPEATTSVWAAGVDIIPAGNQGIVENRMADPAMAKMLAVARTYYEVIVLDSPPFLLASGRSVTALADGVLLVARAGKTKRRAIEDMLSDLTAKKTVGVCLNAVKERFLRSETYGTYAYYAQRQGSAAASPEGTAGGPEDAEAPGGPAEMSAESPDEDLPLDDVQTEPKRPAGRWAWLKPSTLAIPLAVLALATIMYRGLSEPGAEPGAAGPEALERPAATAEPAGSSAGPGDVVPSSPTAAPAEPAGREAPAASARLRTATNLHLRTGPSTGNRSLGTLPEGAELELLEERGEWLRVRAAGIEGWVAREGVAFDQESGGTATTEPTSS